MKEKELSMDGFRIIASILIIAVHTYPLLSISETLDFIVTHVLCRIGVPFFFMVTGYFVLPKALNDKKELKKYMIKILKLYIICMLLYLPVNIYAKQINGVDEIVKDILFHGTFYHLWYFPALILGMYFTYFIIKNIKERQARYIFIFLFVIGLFGDSYYGISEKFEIIKKIYEIIFHVFDYTRNGLFFTPIFVYLGYMMKNKSFNLKRGFNIFFIVLFLSLMVFEGLLLHHFNMQRHDSMYIMLIPTMISIFYLLIQNNKGNHKKLRRIATLVYILHPLFIILVRGIAKILHLESLMIDNSVIHFLLVVSMTMIFSICFDFVKGKIGDIYERKRVYPTR